MPSCGWIRCISTRLVLPPTRMASVYTIGHSTRTVPELVRALHEHGVRLLVDVRLIPRSRTNPQFNKEQLLEQLPGLGLQYMWLGKELGGHRKRNKASELNAGWDNASFRGYADYMQCQDFRNGLKCLLQAADAKGPAACMCAEMMHFSCHRSLISDALLVRGWQVQHITAAGKPSMQHKLTKFARVEGHNIIYPAYEHEPRAKRRTHGRAMVTAAAPAEAKAAAVTVTAGGDALDTEVGASGKGSRGRKGGRAATSPAAAPKSAVAKRQLSAAASASEMQGSKQQRVDVMLTRARAKQQVPQQHS
ncbi:hypothetical protein COO60DRAFT_545755 [Scenedesmus sp. NREL 46B-D3]|nr:hypothetical protein COO60DRAFT_545755 [Scenedesmus sp. NREL 46B-D3]